MHRILLLNLIEIYLNEFWTFDLAKTFYKMFNYQMNGIPIGTLKENKYDQ